MAKKSSTPSLEELKCPNCGHDIPIGEVLSHQIAEKVREEGKADLVAMQEEITAREKALAEKEKRNEEAVNTRVISLVAREKERLETVAQEGAQAELDALREQLGSKSKLLEKANATEVALRRQAAELEERAQGLDVEVARKVDEAKAEVLRKAQEWHLSEHQLDIAAKNKQIEDALSQVASLQLKLEAGSQQLQGEVLEIEIEKVLSATFPLDTISEVPKGVNGADVLHRIMTRSGKACGTIIWEVKRTKTFNDDWIAKLKADQRVAKSEIAALVTTAMPDGMRYFGQIDGVWVCSVLCVEVMAAALRAQLIEVSDVAAMNAGREEKAEVIYDYITGQGFRQRVEAIVSAFSEMEVDMAEERRVFERRMAKKEKQVRTVISSTAGMYGDLQATIGSSMESIKLLEAK